MSLLTVSRSLRREVEGLEFSSPVTHVYNPLDYAWAAHSRYLKLFGAGRREVLLVGMNPGPWGMAQTGVPFGEVAAVRDWMKIRAKIGKPPREHPRRPVEGFACRRSEVSGRRLWGWARDCFGEPENFFARFFVYNYCPLGFIEESGRNRTPDKLPAREREPLFEICDRALRQVIEFLRPRFAVGIGTFAEQRILKALEDDRNGIHTGRILHPSPASPRANQGWANHAQEGLRQMGIRL